ncbi:hypothetical protein MKX03_021778, partial [Papaver bracteatum]
PRKQMQHESRLVHHQKKIRHVVLKNKLSSKFLLFNLRRLFSISLNWKWKC